MFFFSTFLFDFKISNQEWLIRFARFRIFGEMSLRPREIVFEESWRKLVDIIQGVITVNRLRKINKLLWQNTFSDVYMLCVAHPESHSKPLYDETKKLLEIHISKIYNVRYN